MRDDINMYDKPYYRALCSHELPTESSSVLERRSRFRARGTECCVPLLLMVVEALQTQSFVK